MYSTKVISSAVSILAVALPFMGVQIGTAELTTTITTIVVVGSGIYVWLRTIVKENRNIFGARK